MSSPSAQAREKRAKPATAWYSPAEGIGAFAAVPHVAPLHDDLLSSFQLRLAEYLKHPNRGKKDDKGGYSVHRAPTLEQIALDLRTSKSTVRRALNGSRKDDPLKDGLVAKKTVQVFRVWSGDKEGGRRVATHYYLAPYGEVLAARRAIPGVALTAGGHLLAIGRRRRPLMADEAETRWHLQPDLAPASERQARQREREYSVTSRAVPPGAKLGEMPATAQPDRNAILQRLLETYHIPANADDADKLLKLAREAAPQIPIEAILDEMDEIMARKVGLERKGARPQTPTNPGWFHQRMPSHAAKWKAAEAARAREREKEARAARDARLNSIAAALAWGDRMAEDPARAASADAVDALEAELYADILKDADPTEVEQARAILRQTRSRSA